MEDQTFTATGFSQELGVHPDTVRRWIRSGRLHAKKNASNQWEIPAREVDRLKSQIIGREPFEVEEAAFRSLEARWWRGFVDSITELLIAAQRYRTDMWEWKQETDPNRQDEIFSSVMKGSLPDLLNKAAKAKQWRDFEELGREMFEDVEARMAWKDETPPPAESDAD